METNIVKYDLNQAAIAKMAGIYMNLAITDLEDQEQFDAVHSGRMVVKGHRVAVEKRRKELKADALAYGKRVDTAAKELFSGLEPIESHLDTEERKVTDEQKRIEAEKAEAERVKIQARVDNLGTYGVVLPFFDVAAMTDEEFEARFVQAKSEYDAEQQRLADEEAARKAELEAIAKEREKQARKAEELAEQQRKIDESNAKIEADRKAIEDEKKAEQERKRREEFERQAAEDARIKAEKDAAEKVEREKREAAEQAVIDANNKEILALKEKAEATRKEALRPDKAKLLEWTEWFAVDGNMPVPDLKTEEAETILYDALHAMRSWLGDIVKRVEEL